MLSGGCPGYLPAFPVLGCSLPDRPLWVGQSVARRTPREGVSQNAACRGWDLPSPAECFCSFQYTSILGLHAVRLMYPAHLTVAHALLGYKQNACAQHQDAAYYVEDRSADAAGGGEDRSALVDDICLQRIV